MPGRERARELEGVDLGSRAVARKEIVNRVQDSQAQRAREDHLRNQPP